MPPLAPIAPAQPTPRLSLMRIREIEANLQAENRTLVCLWHVGWDIVLFEHVFSENYPDGQVRKS